MDCTFTSSFGLPTEIERTLRALGPRLDPVLIGKTREAFANQRDLSLPEGGASHGDLAYGEHARQRLDICRPMGDGHPIALFVPGGGFTGGDKAFYAHIPPFLARCGFVAAAINYRLAPEFQWPNGAQDVASAIDWLCENAAAFGGDPSRIVVIGQSAGAVHLAGALFDPRLRPKRHESIRAAALMSGLYDIHAGLVESIPLYFGADESQYEDRSPVRHIDQSTIPVFITLAELDPPFFAPQAAALMSALATRAGKPAPFAWLRGHNHLSPVLGMGAPHDRLGPAIVAEFQNILNAVRAG